jgi:hypothetical protein
VYRRRFIPFLLTLALALLLVAPAAALAAAPWDDTTVSPVLQPPWPVPPEPGDGTYPRQSTTDNLANIPYASVAPLLAQFETEAAAAGVAPRMDWFVIGQSVGGRDLYGVVINALDTPEQQRDFRRWQQISDLALTDPVAAQALLDAYGDDVKIPIFIEASIHGNEYEGVDAAMQVIRDLATTPYGENETVDKLLDHAVVVINPVANPDGRVQGTRSNGAGVDMNRDGFVQSQPEIRASWKFMFDWLPVGGLGLHGYYNVTLIDGLTMPHNPGLEYDIFAHWNQLRTEENRTDFYAANRQVQRPVNDWTSAGNSTALYTIAAEPGGATQTGDAVTITTTGNATQLVVGARVSVLGVADGRYNGVFTITEKPTSTSFRYVHPDYSDLPASGGGTAAITVGSPDRGPAYAQGWDDWGPFYGQTIMATVAVDSSTVEVPGSNSNPSTDRRIGKGAHYLAIYSSADFWVDNRGAMLEDQLERFRRGVDDEPWDPNAIESDPVLVERGFDDYWHNWMYDYPQAYVIPFGAGQRSGLEANRLAQFLLDNRVEVTRLTDDFAWNGATYEAGSYVVWMDQAMRGLAREALGRGVDIVDRIFDLYATPAAWSHGLVWGADVVEVPRGDASFTPSTSAIGGTNELTGGVRDGIDAPAEWYAVSLKGVREFSAVMGLLRDGVRGGIAEEAFDSTTGGRMPAGSLIFPADDTTAAALAAAGEEAGIWFERNVGVEMPATTRVTEAPKVAVLRTTYAPPPYVPFGVMTQIFGPDNVGYVTTGGTGSISLSTGAEDPLLGYDFIWNEGAAWPTNALAQERLLAFFARGGGYMGDNYSGNNYSFLNGSGLLTGSIAQGSTANSDTFGGIHRWVNVAGEASPVTGAYPAEDYGFIANRIWWFTETPAGAVIDARYSPTMTSTGPDSGWVSGMWLNRDATPGVNDGALVIRGTTAAGSRYVAHSSDLTFRFDPERAWLMVGQAAAWTNLTDETAAVAYTIAATAGPGGTIDPSGDVWVAAGGSQTFTITPEPGYMVEDVLVDGQSVGRVTSYTFEDVTADATISATFTPFTYALLPPLNATDITVVKGGSLPVRFRVFDADGASIRDLTPTLQLAKLEGDVWGPEFDPTSSSAPKTSIEFRYNRGLDQYFYNLDTKVLGKGTYRLHVYLGYGGEFFAEIRVR